MALPAIRGGGFHDEKDRAIWSIKGVLPVACLQFLTCKYLFFGYCVEGFVDAGELGSKKCSRDCLEMGF